MEDYQKKKRKFSEDRSRSGIQATTFLGTGKKQPSDEGFGHRKKKDYDYDSLFQKEKVGLTDEQLRQQYAMSQPYRSVSTSGSRTSMDDDVQEVVSGLMSGTSKTGKFKTVYLNAYQINLVTLINEFCFIFF